MRQISHLLFDCDNTLVGSEELAFAACCEVVNKTLAAKGVPVVFTPAELMERFVGKVFWRIITELGEEHGFTLSKQELDALTLAEQNAVISKLASEVQACEGVTAVLSENQSAYTLAVVSSSALPRVEACLRKADLEGFFGGRLFSAASSLDVPTSKPDPKIYLHALSVLHISAEDSVAVEDSVTGVLAAVRANIPCIGYVGALPEHEQTARAKALTDAGASVVISHYRDFSGAMAHIASLPTTATV